MGALGRPGAPRLPLRGGAVEETEEGVMGHSMAFGCGPMYVLARYI